MNLNEIAEEKKTESPNYKLDQIQQQLKVQEEMIGYLMKNQTNQESITNVLNQFNQESKEILNSQLIPEIMQLNTRIINLKKEQEAVVQDNSTLIIKKITKFRNEINENMADIKNNKLSAFIVILYVILTVFFTCKFINLFLFDGTLLSKILESIKRLRF